MAELAAAMETDDESAPSGRGNAVPPAALVPERAPTSAFFECPEGTRERGARPPRGSERWCERLNPVRGRVRHGGYASWHRAGGLHETGRYRNGDRDGVWTRWYANGGMQAQAEFRDGLQHGFQIEWDESGRRKREIRFVEGKPVGR
jgi:hypothetical protein